MRILHVVHQYLPDHVGGTEFYTKWLAEGLQKQGHTVAIFARRSADGTGVTQRDDAGIAVWLAWNGRFQPTNRFTSTFRNPFLHQAFIKTIDEFKPDLVHIQHLMGLPTAIATELHQRKIPFVVSLHDFWWVCANAQLITNDTQEICDGPDKFFNCANCTMARANQQPLKIAQPLLAPPLAMRNRSLRHTLQHAAHLLTPTHFVKDWYVKHGITSTNISAIPLGLDYPDQPEQQMEPEQERPFRVGYIGGLSWQKGVHVLIEAFNQLPQPCELWIAGDMTFDPTYTDQLQEQANDNIHFLGTQSRDAIWQMLREVDIVVIPSIWYESFCFIISEAFAMGVPVIASELGALAERVEHGKNGFLFPAGDSNALHKVLSDLQGNQQKIEQLCQHIPQIPTVHDHVETITAVYNQHLNKK